MFPLNFVDKTECLASLVGIRTGCAVDAQYPFWIEDIEGVDAKKLASMTKASNPNGRDFANQLINNAARQMMGDIELLLNNGYKMNSIVGDMCSTCSLLPTYTVNTGIVIKSVIASRFQIMRITKLTVLANVSGDKTIVIDDGVTPRYYDVTLIAGVLMPIVINYSTTLGPDKKVRISFTDATVPLGQISCATTSSCGCGGSPTSNTPVNITGLTAGVETTAQYGFLPCIAIDCSYDSLVCNLIKQTPNIFGLTMLYKVGELYFNNKRVGDRNNDAVSFNDDEETTDPEGSIRRQYATRYWAKMKGTAGMSGINKIIHEYLKTYRADKCVVCDSKIMTAYATG